MKSDLRTALTLLALLVIAALLNGFALPIAGRNVRPEHVAAPLVFAVFAGWRLWQRGTVVRRDAFALLAVAWVVINGLSSWLYAPQPAESLVHVVRIGFLVAVFLTIANLPFRQAAQWAGAFRLWLVLALLALAYGLVAWVCARYGGLWLPGVYQEPELAAVSIKGTQLERNLFGILAGAVLAVACYTLFAQQRRRTPALASGHLLGLACVLSGCAMVMSLTRSAWIASLVVGPVAYLLFDRGRLARVDRPLLQVSVALPVFFGTLLGLWQLLPTPNSDVIQRAESVAIAAPFSTSMPAANLPRPEVTEVSPDAMGERLSTFRELPADFTVSTRIHDARWALADWRESPWLGRGTGSFEQIHGSRRGSPAWISNLILHTMVDTGLAGLTIQMSLFCLLAWRGWRASMKPTTQVSLQIGLRALILGLLVMFIAYQSTDGTWLAPFWIHLGLIASGIYVAEGTGHTRVGGEPSSPSCGTEESLSIRAR